MLQKIKLYGELAKFVGNKVLEADISSAAEAVRFLIANWPELEQHMADQHYRVSVGPRDIALEELHDPSGSQEIRIIPVIAGAGSTGQILLGVALIALSFVSFGAGAWAGIASTTAATASGSFAAFGIGAMLLFSGISQAISPTPSTDTTNNDPRKSYSFSGIQNVSRAGVPIPVIFGEVLTGSIVVSASIDIDQL